MRLPLRTLVVSIPFFLLTFALSAQLKQAAPPATPILGFSPPYPAAEHSLEYTFQSIPSAEKAHEWHRTFTAEPHPAASERNNQLADFIADEWRKQGWEDVTLRRYDVLHSRPRSVSLEMTEPVHFTASLREDAYDVDPDTKNPAVSSSYFGYSASGDVTAEVVYAHSGNPEDYDLLPKNPALPLSARDARPLLENMNGPEAPKDWQGALPITYRFTGAVKVHVKVDMDTSVQPYTVVEARIRGSELPDEWVLLGNHRDAWVFGGVDPSSGTASMMELTRALGELKQRGIRPRRTMVVCSWDGEEYALMGSAAWGGAVAGDLKKKLVAYLNVDESVAGAATTAGPEGLSFSPSAVASLAPVLVEASKDVRAPSGKSLYEAWRATSMRDTKARSPPRDRALVETRIGSGSDHTVFLNHLGRPVINLDFTGDYGVYHSMYDDHYWMEHIGDPTFEYHVALTRIWGLVTLRLANADVLPFDFGFNASALEQFLGDLEHKNKSELKHLSLKRLHARIAEFEKAGDLLRDATARDLLSGSAAPEKIQRLNEQLLQVESNWLDPAGIPGRPWFQHLLYSSRYTYAHLEFPGLTEAVENRDWKLAAQQAGLLEKALKKNTELLRLARSSWEKK